MPGPAPGGAAPGQVGHRPVGTGESARANRGWWDAAAEGYLAEHGAFLGDARFVWGPEGLSEADAGLLGEVTGRRVLEVGCGAAQCSRWLSAAGADPVGIDISGEMLRHGRAAGTSIPLVVPLVQGDATHLPFGAATFDAACSAYGALPFVADPAAVLREVARVLRPGGRWVFSVTHPVRWSFADDPGPDGLIARDSYWDRTPYVEADENGAATYVEHHRTMGDWVRKIVAAGFRLVDLVEPEWPPDLQRTWGAWSPLRGRVIPGTAIFVCDR